MEHLEKAAPALQKHRRAIDMARADIDKKRAGLRPKFEKIDPAILIAVAAKIAAMKPSEQAAALLPDNAGFDDIHAQAVLTLPPILSGVSKDIRDMCESNIMQKNHGPAFAALADETEAWDTADAALRTAIDALRDAGEFPSPHASRHGFRR